MNRKLLFTTLSFILFTSCASDDLDSINLRETSWEGTIEINSSEPERKFDLIISFSDYRNGFYNITTEPFPLNNRHEEYYSKDSEIYYELNKKILFIHGGYRNILLGEWWIVERKNNYLKLKRHIESKNSTDVIHLKKKY